MRTKNRRGRNRQTEYYVYAKANQMVDHRFTDDVAICKAISKSQAIKKFSKYYADVKFDEVQKLIDKVHNIDTDVLILTDY